MNTYKNKKQFMNRISILLVTAACLLLVSCGDNEGGVLNFKKKKTFTERDVTITPQNSFTDLFLDSTALEQFIGKEKIDSATAQHFRSFYNSRNYQYAWFNQDGLSEPGLAFWNLLNSFISLSKDSSLFDKSLAKKMVDFTDGDTLIRSDKNTITQTELGLTKQFFLYAQSAYAGRIDPEELQWFIPRKKVDALALLDSLVARKGKLLEEWEPVNAQYQALKKELIRFNDIADKGGWHPISLKGKKTIKPGTSDSAILALKQRLIMSGDLQTADSSNRYDSLLVTAVKRAQRRFGFNEDGIIDTALVNALNVPVKQRIEQLLINLERMRWLPEKESGTRIVANIPEFMIHVYENNTKAFDMPIVVGKEGNSTVIFNDELKFIVFSPYWNVPKSIVTKEIMPAMAKNPNYLASQNMEITSNSGGAPEIRQKPGAKNSLGRVKFLFPNNYNIYFHDTPAKSLFKKEKRAFSHGCMRLADAEKMANYLLRDNPEWTPEKIKAAMNSSEEKWVTLKHTIPVYVSYFTAWVDPEGLLNFRDDIYGHDKKMAERLFVQPTTSATPVAVTK
jgi:L,D-transpeptidase YcbB